MDPTPGGVLEEVNNFMTDPTVTILAHLAKAPRVTNPDQLALPDLTECDFPGYAAQAVIPSLDGAIDDQFYGEMGAANVEFASTDVSTPQEITALYVTKKVGSDPTALVSVCLFDPPLMVTANDQLFPFSVTLAAIDTET
jgi:hypothetical protein